MVKDATHAPGYFFNLLLVLVILCFIPPSTHAADPSFCNASSDAGIVVDSVYEVTGNCEIKGGFTYNHGRAPAGQLYKKILTTY